MPRVNRSRSTIGTRLRVRTWIEYLGSGLSAASHLGTDVLTACLVEPLQCFSGLIVADATRDAMVIEQLTKSADFRFGIAANTALNYCMTEVRLVHPFKLEDLESVTFDAPVGKNGRRSPDVGW